MNCPLEVSTMLPPWRKRRSRPQETTAWWEDWRGLRLMNSGQNCTGFQFQVQRRKSNLSDGHLGLSYVLGGLDPDPMVVNLHNVHECSARRTNTIFRPVLRFACVNGGGGGSWLFSSVGKSASGWGRSGHEPKHASHDEIPPITAWATDIQAGRV